MSNKAELIINGKKIELDIIQGSDGKSGIDISYTSAALQGIIGTPSDVRGRVATNSLTPKVTAQLKELHRQLGEQLENLEKAQRVEEER
jgi:hypothetical protein